MFLRCLLTCCLVLPGALAQDVDSSAEASDDGGYSELRAMVEAGEYEEAEELLEDVADDARFLVLKARLYRETGRGADALVFLEASQPYLAGDPEVVTAAAGLRLDRGHHERAEKELRQTLEHDANHVEARTRLGLSLLARGRTAEGRQELQKIREFYRGLSTRAAEALSPTTYVWMGRACQGLDKFREAYEVMYSSALDLDKESPEAHLASGHALLAKYSYPDARSHFKDALKRNPNLAEAHIGLALATYVDFRFPGSRIQSTLQAIDAADFIWEDHPQALLVRGHIAFFDESWDEAERYYRNAIAHNEHDLEAQAMLGALLYSKHRLEEFEALCEKVETLHPRPAPFYAALASKLVERFFYKEAAEFAKRAVEIDPDYWPAYVTFGVNALRVGWDEEGRKWIRRAFESDRFNVWAFNTRALVRHIDKNFTEERSENFIIRMRREDAPFLMPYLKPLLESAKVDMERRYQVRIDTPITVEDFSKHKYFSARSIGLPGLAASGVCFGKMVTLTTPKAIPGNWGAVAVHEFAHVISLQKTGNRVPRWFTEGLSVFEEGHGRRRWTRHYPDEFVEAVHHGQLLGMEKIQGGFTKPRFPGQILLSYYQGGVICQYISDRYGFDKIVAMLDGYRRGLDTTQVFQAVLGKPLKEFDEEFLAHARKKADALGVWPRYLPSQVLSLRGHLVDHPEDVDSWVKLGLAYIFGNKVTDAELTIGKALRLNRDHPDLAALRGFVEFQKKNTKAAIREFERALELGTHYRYRSRVALGILYRRQRKTEKAIKVLREAIEIHPDGTRKRFEKPNPYYQLAGILQGEDRVDEAVEVLEKLLLVARDDVEVRKRLGQYYRTRDNWEKVAHVLGDAVFINPYDLEIHQYLSRAYLETKAYKKAIIELTVLLEGEAPAFDRLYADIAWCHWKLGDNDQARDFARRALKIDSNNERAQEVLQGVGE